MHAAASAEAPGELDQIAYQLDAGSRVVHLAGRLDDPASIASEVLEAALSVRPPDPLFAFAAYLLHLRARSEHLVVVIEDLEALPPATARWLRASLDHSGGALRALGRTHDTAAAERATARLGLELIRPPAPLWAHVSFVAWLAIVGCALLAAALGAFELGIR